MDVILKVEDPPAWEMYESLGYPRPEFVASSAVMHRQPKTT